MENWKDIDGYEGLYQVSDLGRVKSLVMNIFMKFKTDKDGYKSVGLTKNRKQNYFRVHRLVAAAFIRNDKNKPEVNHIDLDKSNNKLSNLEWITARGNKKHYHADKYGNVGISAIKTGYAAHFTLKRKMYHVGCFKTYEEAVSKRKEALKYSHDIELMEQVIKTNHTKFKKNV